MYGAYSKEEKKKKKRFLVKSELLLAWRFLTFFMDITDQCPALPMFPTPSPWPSLPSAELDTGYRHNTALSTPPEGSHPACLHSSLDKFTCKVSSLGNLTISAI